MDFYSNENFPLPVVQRLRELGHDVLTVQEAGKSNQATPDDAILAFATERKRVLVTLNRIHFIRLHQANSAHAGIIVCTFDPKFSEQAERIHETICGHESLDGQLIRINRPARGS